MSRLLQPTPRGGFRDGSNPPDGFVSRIAKFIPSESGTLFTIVNAYLLKSVDDLPSDKRIGLQSLIFLDVSLLWWSILVLVLCFIANLVLLNRLFDKQFTSAPYKGELKRKHITASSIAFIIWAYSIRSPTFMYLYTPFLAILLIGVFLIICWEITPPEIDPNEGGGNRTEPPPKPELQAPPNGRAK
jgi:hypothetical protein